MPTPLSPETEAAITELVGRISVDRSQDAAIRAELAGHLREKIHAYLSGEETLTQADAVILARTHFGNPAAVARALHRAHRPHGCRPGFFAELQGTVFAYVWTMSLAYCITTLIYIPLLVFPTIWHEIQTREYWPEPEYITPVLMCLTAPLLFWASYRHPYFRDLWKRATQQTWMLWLAAALTLNVLTILLFAHFFGGWSDSQGGPAFFLGSLPQDALDFAVNLPLFFGGTAATFILACMFLKRVARPNPSFREITTSLGAWLAASLTLRAVIATATACVRHQYGSLYEPSPGTCLLIVLVHFSLQHFVSGLLVMIAGILIWRRGKAGQTELPPAQVAQ